MSKVKQIVDELISNKESNWEEADRDFLMGLPEEKLSKFTKEVKKAEPTPVANAALAGMGNVATPVIKEEPKKPQTDEEFIANAPPGIQESLRESLASRNAEKSRLVEIIVANKRNVYSKEYLLHPDRKLDELRGIAALAAPDGTTVAPILNYGGAAGAVPTNGPKLPDPPKLSAPKMSKEAAAK